MKERVSPEDQLVVELYTSTFRQSVEFYRRWGFEVVRDEGNFAELRWETSLLFVEEVRDAAPPAYPVGNIRIMVEDVDRYWEMARQLGARVIRPIADRYYGLRDFTISGPDGLGLRFASSIE
ncbi:MAG TPA: VOC family protein [Blastocatellia bacterium]|jgi:catechol 2,3-dioxygenase-like lactoylglutathione lyase family enzyme